MSWYPTDMVRCPGCLEVFSCPIDLHSHRRNNCPWETTRCANGSLRKINTRDGGGYLKAKNPHGNFWIVKFKMYSDPLETSLRILRDGKQWELDFQESVGWSWVEAKGPEFPCRVDIESGASPC